MNEFPKITIVGLGLIGGSLGLALKKGEISKEIWGVVRREESVKEALAVKAVDHATLSMEEGVREADLIFICTPVESIIEKIKDITPLVKDQAIVTDVGSSKQSIVLAGEKYLGKNAFFIGGHPMAGSEKSGLDAARDNLFENAQYILTPTEITNLQAYKKLHSLLNRLGANVIAIDPENHDRFVANISHLPHILSAALINLVNRQPNEKENLLMLAAGGFRDVTRIAAGNPKMWLEICLENKAAIIEALEGLENEINLFKQSIKNNNQESLFKLFKEAQQTRLALPATIHKKPSSLRELLIPVIDRPGIISDITLALGKLGININDIELLHTSPSSAILKLIIADQESSDKAQKILEEKGYEVVIETIPE